MLIPLLFPILLVHGGILGEVQLTQGYDQGKPFDLHVAQIPVEDMEGEPVMLEVQAARAFMRMMRAAEKKGHVVKVNYGFRTHEQQTYWHNRYDWLCKNKDTKYCNMAAMPGWSTHQQGVSVDISQLTVFLSNERVKKSKYYTSHIDKWVEGEGCRIEDNAKGYVCYTSLYYWLVENAHKYGFHNDVPGEHWHWTYESPSETAVGG